MKNTSLNKNIEYIKGFAILLVVLGHAVQMTAGFNNIVFRLIYAFHMPLFFFLSGYVTGYSPTNDTQQLRKRFFRLVLPFFAWAFISFVVLSIKNGKVTFSYWTGLYKNVDNGLWFLWVLFLMHLLFFLSEKIKGYGKNYALLIVLLLLQILPGSILGLWLLKTYMIYFVIGYYINNHKMEFFIQNQKYFLLAISLLFFALLFPFYTFEGNTDFLKDFLNSDNSTVLALVNKVYRSTIALCGISCIYALFHIARLEEKSLTFLGKNTLEIYSGHQYFLGIGVIFNLTLPLNILLSATLALAASLLLAILLKKSKILKLIFYGIPIKKMITTFR